MLWGEVNQIKEMLTLLTAAVELRKLRQRIKLIRTAEARLTQRNTKANRSSNYHDEKHVSRKSAHEPRSHDSHGGSSSSSSSRRRRYSYSAASSRAPEYSVHEYEEERRRPSHVDTVKAQRDYYYAHALPSPYRGMIEDTPRDEDFDEDDKERGRRGGERHGGREKGRRHDEDRGHGQGQGGDTKSSRTETYRSRSNSTYHRGRPRSRSSVTTERKQERVVEVVSSDADSEAEAEKDRDRRRKRHSSYGGGHERGREFRRRSEWVDA